MSAKQGVKICYLNSANGVATVIDDLIKSGKYILSFARFEDSTIILYNNY